MSKRNFASEEERQAYRKKRAAQMKAWRQRNAEHHKEMCRKRAEDPARRERRNAGTKAWRDKNKERVSEKNKAYRLENAEALHAKEKDWYENRGGKDVRKKSNAAKIRRYKQTFLDAYGASCQCGESRFEALCADHIADDGAQHRRENNLRGSTDLYRWAAANGFPPILQTLCFNCNAIKHVEYMASIRKYGESTAIKHLANIRRRVIDHYSNGTFKCANQDCGFDRYEALQIDHIDGGGRKHLEEIGGNLASWLEKNGFPPGYQILCATCNALKHRRGF